MVIRAQWSSLPLGVTEWVEAALGGSVVAAVSQPNGFSSGTADRVRTAGGRAAFVKAISRERNIGGFELHRREAAVMRALPSVVHAPELLDAFDDGEWVALLFADIDGDHPRRDRGWDIPAVLDSLTTLPRADARLRTLPLVRDKLRKNFDGWRRLREDGLDPIPSFARNFRDRIVATAAAGADAAHGSNLVHLDCRVDNLLRDRQGAVWIIDWPWASIGAAWLDGLTYLLDVILRDESIDVEPYLEHPLFTEMTAEHADSVIAGFAGAHYDNARQPAPPDMPTIRAFQKAEADAAVTWLSRRWA